MWSVRLKVALWTDTPISAVELCSSFRVIFGLFVASLIKALLAWSVSFSGLSWQVCCGAIFFPFFNNGFKGAPWDVPRTSSSSSLYFSTTLTLTCLESYLVFMLPLAWWCCRPWGLSEQVYVYMLRSCDRSCDT